MRIIRSGFTLKSDALSFARDGYSHHVSNDISLQFLKLRTVCKQNERAKKMENKLRQDLQRKFFAAQKDVSEKGISNYLLTQHVARSLKPGQFCSVGCFAGLKYGVFLEFRLASPESRCAAGR